MENYYFNLKKAKTIDSDPILLKAEALTIKKAFEKQGNEKHSLEGQTNYHNSLFMEKVFYEQLVPLYNTLK